MRFVARRNSKGLDKRGKAHRGELSGCRVLDGFEVTLD
jgi:hypothetical protein